MKTFKVNISYIDPISGKENFTYRIINAEDEEDAEYKFDEDTMEEFDYDIESIDEI